MVSVVYCWDIFPFPLPIVTSLALTVTSSTCYTRQDRHAAPSLASQDGSPSPPQTRFLLHSNPIIPFFFPLSPRPFPEPHQNPTLLLRTQVHSHAPRHRTHSSATLLRHWHTPTPAPAPAPRAPSPKALRSARNRCPPRHRYQNPEGLQHSPQQVRHRLSG